MAEYYSLSELMAMIEEPNATACQRILTENYDRFSKTRGSTHNHQAWEGGYLDHITDTMNLSVVLYNVLNNLRPIPFSLSDALLSIYLHDIEKPWRFEQQAGEWVNKEGFQDKETEVWQFVQAKIDEYGFVLTADHWNAIQFAEGEKSAYKSTERVMQPLAAFVHMCDTWSARGWYDFPQRKDRWR